MLATILQIAGFAAGWLFLILYYTLGGHSPWPFLFEASYTVHFVGDILGGFLRAPLIVGRFNISEMLIPKTFMQFVGGMLMLGGFLFMSGGHHDAGNAFFFWGFALWATGFVWSLIYP